MRQSLIGVIRTPCRVEKVTPDGVHVELLERTVSFTHGMVYWSIILTLVILGSLLIFRRRDVI